MKEVISVRFRGGNKSYYFDPQGISVEKGQAVLVETASGTEYAICSEGNHEVPEESVVEPLRSMIRIATENDSRTNELNRKREKDAFHICEKKILAHKLEMKLIRVESNFDGSKIIFFFTADGRVDFRELVKDLASIFRARIELRQVGVRDEAKMLGGIGICGQPLCCSRFLDDFMPVSIKMAKTQNLSLNPTKISGTCGRLMCCLKYEQNAYEDAVKRLPKNDSFVNTPDGIGNVVSVDLLKEEMKVKLDSGETPKTYKVCEVQVLRNGKGSREGIEIPTKRPERYVPPQTKEERQSERLSQFLAAYVDTDEEKKATKKNSANRPPRGEKAGRKGETPKREKPERKATPVKVEKMPIKVEKIPVRVSGDSTAEKKAAADRRAAGHVAGQVAGEKKTGGEKRGNRRPRHFRRGSSTQKGGNQNPSGNK